MNPRDVADTEVNIFKSKGGLRVSALLQFHVY